MMNFREKLDKVLKDKKLSKTKLEELCGFGSGTITAAYRENRELSSMHTSKLLETLGINSEWWTTGKGEIFNKKGTYVETLSDNKENEMETDQFLDTFKSLVEGNTEYLLVPRGVLKDNYRLISLEQYQKDQAQIEKEKQQITKDMEQIQIYKEELKNKNKHIEILLLTNKGLYEQLNSVHGLKAQLLPPEKSQQNP